MNQVLVGMGVVYSIPFPGMFKRAMERMGGYVNLDLAQIMPMPIRCLYPFSFVHKLLLKTGGSLLLVMILCAPPLLPKESTSGTADTSLHAPTPTPLPG